jgi:hypothetical protein
MEEAVVADERLVLDVTDVVEEVRRSAEMVPESRRRTVSVDGHVEREVVRMAVQ